ncbi:MAG: hypothetical protein JNL11_19720 [Bdellovibrionaceae bacterium]|nr:hypothetical protein [Pseudobdellovibrionaceae bacterium]
MNTNPHQILEQVRTEKREIAETLMSTQQQNGSVEITFTNGIAGRIRGSVSNFRIEDGQAVFEIGGQTHSLFNVGEISPIE